MKDKATATMICRETNPDVIVISTANTLLFEPQNARASEWLHRRCGLITEDASGNTEIRVHPTMRGKIVAELKAAGFQVAGPARSRRRQPRANRE